MEPVYHHQSVKIAAADAIDATLGDVRRRLAAAVEPAFRDGMIRYFQHQIQAYGVRSPVVRKLAQYIHPTVKQWTVAQRNRFCEELWRSGIMEEGALAIYLYRRFARQFSLREFQLFERWIDRYAANWAHTDGVASYLVAAAIVNQPDLSERLEKWTRSGNLWKRRAAAVSLVREARKGASTDRILSIVDKLLPDSEPMVRKGVGWLLREAWPKRKHELEAFLLPRRHLLRGPAWSALREVLSPAERSRLKSRPKSWKPPSTT